MPATEAIHERENDLTIHVCARCGRPIEGVAIRVEDRGVVSYRHATDCEPDADRGCHVGIAQIVRGVMSR